MPVTLFTIGHSNRPLADFLTLLEAHDIRQLVDIRAMPRSRFNPHFSGGALAASLKEHGIVYIHMPELGGMRKARADSPHTALRAGGGLQGYADYMDTPEFEKALARLVALGSGLRTAYMCAEADPQNCHRQLVADALLARGISSQHITRIDEPTAHAFTRHAQIHGEKVSYPAKAKAQASLF